MIGYHVALVKIGWSNYTFRLHK